MWVATSNLDSSPSQIVSVLSMDMQNSLLLPWSHQKERSQWALGGKLVCAEGYKTAIGQIFLCGVLLFFKVAATMWNKNLWASDLQSEILFYHFLLQGFGQIFIFFIVQESHHCILVLAPLKMIVIEEIQTRQEHFFPRSHNDHSIILARPFSNNGSMVK